MALNITGLKRVFKYGNRTLDDPNKNMTPDEVMAFYAGTYPELTTSNVHSMYHVSQDTSEQRLVPKASPLLF